MQDRDFWDGIIEQIEQFRRANRFGTVQLKIRNHEIVHFEMTPVMRGELPKRPSQFRSENPDESGPAPIYRRD